jgi:hypothetical protein
MKTLRRWQRLSLAGIGSLLLAVSGCQTWFPEAGLTLPTGHYLRHQPQFIPPSPGFPLSRELANLEDAYAQPGLAGPRPIVPGGGQP